MLLIGLHNLTTSGFCFTG